MKNLKRKVSIDASAQADIAFLLLIFYLVATTISSDWGILRKLPPENKDPLATEIHQRNVIEILVNQNGEILFEKQLMEIHDLSEGLKNYILNENDLLTLPEKVQLEDPDYGLFTRTKHVISLQNHRQTKYADYIKVQDQILAVYADLRNAVAIKEFGLKYSLIKERAKSDSDYLSKLIFIKKVVPQRLSEADPVAIR